ncbi:MAG: hypothetical protein EBT14_08730, partial [Betaproteobacteria bacterium]|nr:hypothetical protein [Betaproteobacteria bacterium]
LALLGLALAVGFGFQAVTTAAVGSWVNQRRAIETVMRWQQTLAAGDWRGDPDALPTQENSVVS